MVPGPVLDLIKNSPPLALVGVLTSERQCQGAKHHSPRPMTVTPFRVVAEDEIVYLCGTCADNVSVLLALLKAHRGDVPWIVMRCFGNLVRSVADRMYASS